MQVTHCDHQAEVFTVKDLVCDGGGLGCGNERKGVGGLGLWQGRWLFGFGKGRVANVVDVDDDDGSSVRR
ncbi:hypothetical protein PIB30_019462 [Stylosanthes scabra]|uniref:Uncharacterized protein n=1 Tax=Stylosanthes scabra TaxID=79078 RepID=A0ABU6S9M0_9FABA|nr:hypothetical protein [Stylosanthes scabra]